MIRLGGGLTRSTLLIALAILGGGAAIAQTPLPGAAGVASEETLPPLPPTSEFVGPSVTAPATADGADSGDEGGRRGAISGNPGAVNILTGSGALGDFLGINRNGFRIGGINITDANGLLSGGLAPGKWTGDTLTIFDVSLDTEKSFGLKGGLFGTQFLYFSGGPVNQQAGTVLGYNSLVAGPPLNRAELYQLWYRQEFLDKRLIVRMGKSVPTYDFNNVVRSIPVGDAAYDIPAVSSAIFTPLYVSPTQYGIMPGYYNSATGMVVTFLPTPRSYVQYGLFDGNLAAGRQTGLEGPHFNQYKLHLGEVGLNWMIGRDELPGKFGLGYWWQTGRLKTASDASMQGAQGFYLFGSQRLYYESPGRSHNGLSLFYQFATTGSDFAFVQRYFGCGLTYFGPIPGRDHDSLGFGLAYGRTNPAPDAGALFFPSSPDTLHPLGKSETILTWYYQMQVTNNFLLQPNLSYIPDPAQRPGIPEAFAITLRAILLY